MKTILEGSNEPIHFFGSRDEIFAVIVNNISLFLKHKHKVKKLYLNKEIDRCIGWEIYRSLQHIPWKQHQIKNNYTLIEDETNDIDYPSDYENFKRYVQNKRSNRIINAISVIIPCHNNTENTKKLLSKLIYQKINYYPETEIIVVESASTEDMSFLDQYPPSQIIVKHVSKPGVSHARNVGLDLARGDFIAFIDNDDDIADNYLHCIYKALREKNCYYDFCVITSCSDGNIIHDYSKIDLKDPIKQIWSVWQYAYNRRIINDIQFDETLIVAEDIDWLRKVLPEGTKKYKGTLIKEPLYFYKWANNENSLSHKFNRKEIKVRSEN